MKLVPPRPSSLPLGDWVAQLPTIFASHAEISGDVRRAAHAGLLRKVGPRVYTTDVDKPLEAVVAANALAIASLRHPGAIISHRSAFEMRPGDGYLFLTGPYEATDHLAGLTIRLVRGPGPLPGDMPVLDFYRASNARAYLENLARTRRTSVSRVLPRREIEERLERMLRHDGEDAVNALRDQARELADPLGAQDAFDTLNELIGTLLMTREAPLVSAAAQARAVGSPFDPARVDRFRRLAAELRANWATVSRPMGPLLRGERQNLAFVDAYFSNYIEGTEFEIDEARGIVFDDVVPAARPADAHDIRATFELLVDPREMTVSVAELGDAESFEHLLQRRHRQIMAARPEKRPGEFKELANRAGNTLFVEPELVRGTLERALELLVELETSFQRAAFVMFVIAEVHPFDDGNGRVARAMANAELDAGEQARFVIVTAYREDYLGALRRLSRQDDPGTYCRMLDRAQELVARLDFADLDAVLAVLEACNAFDDTGRRVMKLPPAR